MNPEQPSIDPVTQPEVFHQSSSKSFRWLWIAMIGFFIAIVGAGAYFLGTQQNKPYVPSVSEKRCTLEAKICPDGSSVGRTGPNCEFTPCPTLQPTTSTDQTVNWKTYTSKYGYSIKYPDNLIPAEDVSIPSVDFQFNLAGKSMGASGPAVTILVSSAPFSSSPKGNVTQNGVNLISNWKEITVDNTAAHAYSPHQCAPSCPGITVDIPYKNGRQTIVINNFLHQETFDQMLSTFRFENLTASKSTDQNQASASSH